MDNSELQQLVESVSEQWFQKPFLHTALFNARLRTTAGRYLHGSHSIEINPRYHALHGPAELISTIKHELCHYHLALGKRPFKHSSPEFKLLLAKVGAALYAQPSPGLANKRHRVYFYVCIQCSHAYRRSRRINTRRYVCGKCRGKLLLRENGSKVPE